MPRIEVKAGPEQEAWAVIIEDGIFRPRKVRVLSVVWTKNDISLVVKPFPQVPGEGHKAVGEQDVFLGFGEAQAEADRRNKGADD